MDLASVFRKYAAEGTGQLALKFADTSHLCKVAIEDGEAVYIGLGTLSPEETLSVIADKQLLEANFIKGFRPRKRLPQPITSQLVGDDVSAAVPTEAVERHIVTGTIGSGTVVTLLNDYVDIVGPLGVVMAENYIKKLGYSQGDHMDADVYNELVRQLLVDMPESLRKEFLEKHT